MGANENAAAAELFRMALELDPEDTDLKENFSKCLRNLNSCQLPALPT
jgi:Tfp pilus assembly protein PilF